MCAFRWLILRPQVLNLRSRNQIRGKLLLSQQVGQLNHDARYARCKSTLILVDLFNKKTKTKRKKTHDFFHRMMTRKLKRCHSRHVKNVHYKCLTHRYSFEYTKGTIYSSKNSWSLLITHIEQTRIVIIRPFCRTKDFPLTIAYSFRHDYHDKKTNLHCDTWQTWVSWLECVKSKRVVLAAVCEVITLVNCQSLAFTVGVSQHMHKIRNLWTFELNWSSNLRDNNERKKHHCHTKLFAFRWLISRPHLKF